MAIDSMRKETCQCYESYAHKHFSKHICSRTSKLTKALNFLSDMMRKRQEVYIRMPRSFKHVI